MPKAGKKGKKGKKGKPVKPVKAVSITDEDEGPLTRQQLAEFKKMFTTLDKDKDQRLSGPETVTCLRGLHFAPSEAEVQSIQQDIFEKYEGLVDFEQFCLQALRFVQEDELPEQVLRRAFRIWDKELTGLISATELLAIVSTLGEILPQDEIGEFMKEANADREGFVNYEDFIVRLTMDQ